MVRDIAKLGLWKTVSLVFLFLTSAVFLFYNAFRFEMPLGFSGMYTWTAEQISDNRYLLPETIPFYGPGGVLFAYPPLGFYVMAFVTDLFDVSSITYLRFVPPLFSLLSLVPLFLLVEKMTASFWAAFFSTAFLLFSPILYYNHTWSAGMVRGLAFFLMLSGFYCFYRALEEEKRLFAVLTGIFLGLTSLTHLFYGLFFFLWVACWWIAGFRVKALKTTFLTFLTGGLVGIPWLYLMITRYGVQVFKHAFSSHDNAAFLDVFGQASALWGWLSGKFMGVPIPVIGFALAGLAIIYLIYRRQFGIPAVLMAMTLVLSPEGDRFLVLVIAMLVGVSFVAGAEWFRSKWIQSALIGCILVSIFQVAGYGMNEVMDSVPVLHRNAFDVADYVEENMPENSRYLFVAGQAEAEWFPYVLKREPFVSKWGSEWLGTYDEQRTLQGSVAYCKDEQTLQCLKDLGLDAAAGDILITKKNQRRLANELEASASCRQMAVLGVYVVWSADCLIP
ncbi:MAG: glycosyltransferase family 39 protein [Chloroflexi bacterium]|nr:glycosyltransferase family 39 protein [Chloroflexota bacterium]